ncbi:hypothetical protein EDD11_009133 [Mortierella claussenii]|nr:hypothetical protein EDD11_009133 [Mortierella claussenii]
MNFKYFYFVFLLVSCVIATRLLPNNSQTRSSPSINPARRNLQSAQDSKESTSVLSRPGNDLEARELGAEAHKHDFDAIPTWDQLLHGLNPPPGDMKMHGWNNWAGNQYAYPAHIFYPGTIHDLIAIVKGAKAENKKLRCAGSGHSWSSSSVVNGDGFLVIVNKMEKMYDPVHIKDDVWTVEVETGVLVKDLDNFLREHDPPLALPSNVVLDSVRYGGILSMGCHGAATHTHTLPDLVGEVKIIDASGVLNTFSKEKDPIEFSAAIVNLGLLGIIYSYTIRVEPMFKLLMSDTHPLLSDYFNDPKVGGPKLRAMVLENDQTEIFYWPFNAPGLDPTNDHLWVKQWRRSNRGLTETPVSDAFQNVLQNLGTSFGNKVYEFMAANPSSTPFLSHLIYSTLNTNSEQVLYAPHAIHYQAGIDHIPCLDLETAFKVDTHFENVVKAWRYVVDLIYELAKHGKFPLNLTMEMRFVKASTMIMSNAYDEDPEAIYCMIEILSVVHTPGFNEFSAKVAQYWMDSFQAKPHWAKLWEHVPGIIPYLRKKAGSRFDKFDAIRKKYDPEGMFMTSTFAGILGH